MELLARLKAALSDRYAVEREIGRGGMAVVFLARDLRHDRQVALKVLSEEVASVLGAKRFLAEIGIAARLQHPHILSLLDSGEVDGIPYYVMPYVAGESLRQRLNRETQLPLEVALQIARDVADALEHAHSEGIVHRDIKPENILLSGSQAIVADFGVARALSEAGGESLTDSGIAIGTPRYMSPEQAAGSKRVDGRSNIYALGCVLYEMLAGEPPFSGATPQAVMAKHVHEPPPPLRIVRPGLPEGVQQAIERALAKVPADRFESCADFRDQLDAGASRPRSKRRTRFQWPRVVLMSGLGATVLASLATRAPFEFLDPHRVVVYPLVVSTDTDRAERVGEGMATVIGNALDGVGFLRWLDGWRWLDPAEREDVRTLTDDKARAIARERGAAMYVDGRVVHRGDSLEVMMELYDVRGDSSIARASAVGAAEESWRLALRAVSSLLPTLIPPGRQIDLSSLNEVHPTAAAHFLQGESEYRLSRFVDALEHYREAVAADSTFALAARRGAQAASWKLKREEAAQLVDVALNSPNTLKTRELLFARGLDAYLAAKADGAVDYLRRALRIDPDWPDAWMALGEVFTHLLPREPTPDSQATAAFAEARRLDPQFSPPLFHLLETAIRLGEIQNAEALLRDFERSDPDSTIAKHIDIMWNCVAEGPENVGWRVRAQTMPGALSRPPGR